MALKNYAIGLRKRIFPSSVCLLDPIIYYEIHSDDNK